MDSGDGDNRQPREPLSEAGPLRLAFVGQSVYFRACALELPADGFIPSFVDFRAGASLERLLGALQIVDPDVVLVFRPEIIPHGLFAALRATTLGYLTEPLPRARDRRAHRDLTERLRWLQRVDAGNFDRIVSFDPLVAETAGSILPVWRSQPLPVADSLFSSVRERAHPPRLLFIGRSTAHRERLLESIKRRHPLVHIGHGLLGEQLRRFFDRTDVQLNLHNNPYPTFENRVSVALAAGHLVISEPLEPRHDLRPGQDYLEADDADGFTELVAELAEDPQAYTDVQDSGRQQAERFRASVVYPGLIRRALEDVAERGSGRRRP